MTAAQDIVDVASRDNALLKRVRRLSSVPTAYREQGQIWLEGEHLCEAAQVRGVALSTAIVTHEAWEDATFRRMLAAVPKIVRVTPALYRTLSGVEETLGLGALAAWTPARQPLPGIPTLVLDRVQDAGNVGTMMRSAAAFGCAQVVALSGTAALGSPKVLRSGMGAHFSLHCVEGVEWPSLLALELPLLATSSHAGQLLPEAPLPHPCAWVFGHEGQGVDEALMQHCHATVRIPQPGGQESLNVAAAAAVCLYETARRRAFVPGLSSGC